MMFLTRNLFAIFCFGMGFATKVLAQAPQPSPTLSEVSADTVAYNWFGVPNRTYFPMYSLDLAKWDYFGLIMSGESTTHGLNVTSNNTRLFFRLKYTDIPTSNPETADFDNDGLSNIAELTSSHTDPFLQDTDNDGLSDMQEILLGLDPLIHNGSGGIVNSDLMTPLSPEQLATYLSTFSANDTFEIFTESH